MKNLFIILIITVNSVSCQSRHVQFSYVKIAPIGDSDVPRETLYISMQKIADIVNINSIKHPGFIRNNVVVDEKTLLTIMSFVNENSYKRNTVDSKFIEFGCLNISINDKNSIIRSYKIDRLGSKRFLQSLVNILVEKKLDMKLIKELKERCLEPIDY